MRWLALIGVVVSFGCAPIPYSTELQKAERAVARARARGAARLSPDHLLEAEQRLQEAIEAHDRAPRGIRERHLAYLAHRLAEIARAYAELAAAEERKDNALQRYSQAQRQLRLAAENRALRAEASLDQERRARLEAEQRARAAIRSLQQIAKIREEQRELVITLSGAVLFGSGQSQLLPIAKETLSRVAEVLRNEAESSAIVVEGHTDSRGSAMMNENLSQARAAAVRLYLISAGVNAGRITAVGKGEAEPVASNATAEGRANNRRVEIRVSR
jgi:outer membrane protein OmpA-like peptidoglycan-associated protein